MVEAELNAEELDVQGQLTEAERKWIVVRQKFWNRLLENPEFQQASEMEQRAMIKADGRGFLFEYAIPVMELQRRVDEERRTAKLIAKVRDTDAVAWLVEDNDHHLKSLER